MNHEVRGHARHRGVRKLGLACVLVAGVLVGLRGLTAAGVCISQARRVSHGELVDVAIARAIDRQENFVDGVSYSGVEEFRRRNPTCCAAPVRRVYASGTERLLGFGAYQVRLQYVSRSESPEPYADARVIVHQCGRLLRFSAGAGRNLMPPGAM